MRNKPDLGEETVTIIYMYFILKTLILTMNCIFLA